MAKEPVTFTGTVCPLPIHQRGKIILGHGSGGKLMHDLIEQTFYPHLDNPILRAGNDASLFTLAGPSLIAVSTDSHVVSPLFFPGGDIGRLAVCGTVNDVAMMGAKPIYLTAGFILEEGLDLSTLETILTSMRIAADEAGVKIVAGDTKVVQKGRADGLYINTAGIGIVYEDIKVGGNLAQPGDAVILSGTIGDHGIAVLNARGDLGFEANIESDVAPLNHLIGKIVRYAQERNGANKLHVFRDPTRGGLATSLNEIARQSHLCITINEEQLIINPTVNAACEILGLDPVYIANEGKFLAIVGPSLAKGILEILNNDPLGKDARLIGEVVNEPAGRVLMRTIIGSTRVLDIPSGELLPRIC